MIANFLNEYPDFPIVTHGARHDYLLVLKPAFEKVNNLERLPSADRWQCTIVLSKRLPMVGNRTLDNVLVELGYSRRVPGAFHDAIHDAQLCGLCYMKLVRLEEKPAKDLGFLGQ